MSVTFAAVEREVRLAASEATSSLGLSLYWENEKGPDSDHPSDEGYVAIRIIPGSAPAVSIGSTATRHRHVGSLLVAIHLPKMTGTGEALDKADPVAQALRGQTFGSSPRVRFGAPRVARGPSNETSRFFRMDVVTTFEADEIT